MPERPRLIFPEVDALPYEDIDLLAPAYGMEPRSVLPELRELQQRITLLEQRGG